MNKRGMAPLVATLLLIAFAVAIGVVIMTFGKAQVELEAECSINIGLKFAKIAGQEQFCYDQTKKELFLTVENGVNIPVEELVVNIIGSNKAVTHELKDAKISKAGTYLKRIPYNINDVGTLRQIKIIPKIEMYEEIVICQEKAIILEKVRNC
jgi:hypothetical protein